jgi:D-alanyl-D-alanine carboxypeptidase
MNRKVMKNITFWSFLVFLSTLTVLGSCKKGVDDNPNQIIINQMQAVTDSIIQNTHVPGVVALVVDHKMGIDWIYTAGYSDIPNKLPMDESYTFRIASVTKTLTVTVLLQLVDEGKVALNDKLSKYFPAYPKSDSITIAMLCDMTSGIFDYVYDPLFFPALIANPEKIWQPQELVDIAFSHDFNFSPGNGWDYSSTNTIIVGQIIELLTGNTLGTEINSRIIQPLNLIKTGFLPSGTTFPGPHGKGYYLETFVENEELTEHFDISWGWAAGAAYSTPRELQKYTEVLASGGLLSDSLQKRRLSDLHIDELGDYYGLGVMKWGSFYGHKGAVMSFTSIMFHSNEKDCTVIIYFNCLLELRPDFLFHRYMDILYGKDY